eukprot:gene6616-7307_t
MRTWRSLSTSIGLFEQTDGSAERSPGSHRAARFAEAANSKNFESSSKAGTG